MRPRSAQVDKHRKRHTLCFPVFGTQHSAYSNSWFPCELSATGSQVVTPVIIGRQDKSVSARAGCDEAGEPGEAQEGEGEFGGGEGGEGEGGGGEGAGGERAHALRPRKLVLVARHVHVDDQRDTQPHTCPDGEQEGT
eukprot:scaffold5225_cov64-Phaeocystis_antarctica.AAC.4